MEVFTSDTQFCAYSDFDITSWNSYSTRVSIS